MTLPHGWLRASRQATTRKARRARIRTDSYSYSAQNSDGFTRMRPQTTPNYTRLGPTKGDVTPGAVGSVTSATTDAPYSHALGSLSWPSGARQAGCRRNFGRLKQPKNHHLEMPFFGVFGSKFSSRGYRPAPLFGRTPPSAVTRRRHPARGGRLTLVEAQTQLLEPGSSAAGRAVIASG